MGSEAQDAGQVRVRLAHRDDIPVNSGKRVCLGRRVIAIFNVEGQFYATGDTCTHGPASLAEEGFIDGDVVECSLHGGMFHIPTGKPVKVPSIIPLETYPVHVDSNGEIYAEVDSTQ